MIIHASSIQPYAWARTPTKPGRVRPLTCLNIFCDLAAAAINVSQDLSLQHHFEPEVNLVGNNRLLLAVHELGTALDISREREALADFEWKGGWYVLRGGGDRPLCSFQCKRSIDA
jgi:hypothetical protein